MLFGIRLEGWLTIAAIILGPVLAFAIQHWRDQLRDARERKRKVFHQLLMTFKAPMAPVHVDAINSIPLEFHSDATVNRAWRLYTSHLNNNAMLKGNPVSWGERKFQLLTDLVFEMGKSLGYEHIDKATLQDNIYVPQGYEDRELQFQEIRGMIQRVLKGEHPISVTMLGPVQIEPPLPTLEEFPSRPQPTLPVQNTHGQ